MVIFMNNQLIQQLKKHEGFRSRVYKCTAGCDTIGYGYNMDANPLKLTNYELVKFRKEGIEQNVAEWLLMRMVDKCHTDLVESITWFESLDEVRQAVLINMCFNLGIGGLMQFKNTLAMIKAGDYKLAADAMLKSKWATQVHGRATELAKQMELGVFAHG
jgi:lysozyme